MEFGSITRFLTGVAVPVFSLKTEESVGIGEFLDLVKLGKWCKKTGLDIIQILPVNDTGADSSPYNAISAFALHPIYIRLEEIKGWESFKDGIAKEREAANQEERVNYKKIYAFKEGILKAVYAKEKKKIAGDKKLAAWISETPWLITYCVYRCLKDANAMKSWQEWTTMKDPSAQEITSYWKENQEKVLFYAWVQFNLEKQLRSASLALEEMGLRLKGDIPILINEDSADVWGQRHYFDLSMRAGAPPDMFSERGQNWGFPVYRWDVIEKDDYRWWRLRLNQASKFYHAYRIDHVLGFFRLWEIPCTESSGTLGRFNPVVPITDAELKRAGFDDALISSLVRPEFTESHLRNYFGGAADYAIKNYFVADGRGNLVFSDKVAGERYFDTLEKNQTMPDIPNIKDKLVHLYWDTVLVQTAAGKGTYTPAWFYQKTRTFNSLPGDRRAKLMGVIERNSAAQNELWRKNGLKLLKMMVETTNMLVCAEDLGVIPDCVPEVLEELNILGLKVERWTRHWHMKDSPYIDPAHYPRLSVCSPSFHDTTTLRGWWEEGNWDRNQYFHLIGMKGGCPDFLSSEVAAQIVRRNLRANSLATILLLPDILSLYYNLRTKYPGQERINVPGTVSDTNWSYRMKDTLEFLSHYDEFNNYIKAMVEERRLRQFG